MSIIFIYVESHVPISHRRWIIPVDPLGGFSETPLFVSQSSFTSYHFELIIRRAASVGTEIGRGLGEKSYYNSKVYPVVSEGDWFAARRSMLEFLSTADKSRSTENIP